jgi:hypothetical protein
MAKTGPVRRKELTVFGLAIEELFEEHPELGTKADLLRYLGCDRTHLRRYEVVGGRKTIPSDVLVNTAAFFGTTTDRLLGIGAAPEGVEPDYPAWRDFKKSETYKQLTGGARAEIARLRPHGEPTIAFYQSIALGFLHGVTRSEAIAAGAEKQGVESVSRLRKKK